MRNESYDRVSSILAGASTLVSLSAAVITVLAANPFGAVDFLMENKEVIQTALTPLMTIVGAIAGHYFAKSRVDAALRQRRADLETKLEYEEKKLGDDS